MALTKLPKSAFGTGSVDDTKIEDGTIQNQEISGTLPEEKLATGTIANASLSNSSITINGTSISLGGSSSVGVDVNWQSVQTTGFTAVAGNGYFVDTTSGAITVTLPASASLGDQIAIKDYAGTFASNNLTIGRNGHNIQGVANDSLISTNRASLLLVYVDSTKGWIYAEESNVGDLQAAAFTSATGGTVTTSGDYKIHTFTGDGCFTVSILGNGPTVPTGGPNTVSYLVVAGGGAGGAGTAFGNATGGGGGGGYREGRDIAPSYTASPLVAPTGLTITATTYPVTVGAGASGQAGGSTPGIANGSNSIFSTITSAGGGGGGSANTRPGANGGSGGGSGGGSFNNPGGSGNTPPTSPPQGNNGGNTTPGPPGPDGAGAGGGGATAVGGNSTNGPIPVQVPNTGDGGPGGAGATTSISGSPTAYSGGGGGGSVLTVNACTNATIATGGSGGGGNGAPSVIGCCAPNPGRNQNVGEAGVAGTANTGGGGGGSTSDSPATGASGGKGIVIIRYKFQ